jgi:hypothetical protein
VRKNVADGANGVRPPPGISVQPLNSDVTPPDVALNPPQVKKRRLSSVRTTRKSCGNGFMILTAAGSAPAPPGGNGPPRTALSAGPSAACDADAPGPVAADAAGDAGAAEAGDDATVRTVIARADRAMSALTFAELRPRPRARTAGMCMTGVERRRNADHAHPTARQDRPATGSRLPLTAWARASRGQCGIGRRAWSRFGLEPPACITCRAGCSGRRGCSS